VIQTETLALLEWARLCQHLGTFAATKLGTIAAQQLTIPASRVASQQLLTQTTEIGLLSEQGELSFEGIADINVALRRAGVQGLINGSELYEVATTLAGARRLRRTIDQSEDSPILKELVADLRTHPELEQEIYHCIDDRGDVTDRASEKLRLLRIQLKSSRDQIQQKLNNILQRHGNAIHQPTITQRSDRFVIQVKATHKATIPGIVHDVSASGSTLYIEPQSVVGLGNQLRQEQRQEQREVEVILRALSDKVAEFLPDLEHLVQIVTAIDLALARFRYSNWLGANPPRFLDITDPQQITLRQLRHPLLVWQQQHEEGPTVVPTDLVVQPYTRVVTITGPNTGGKTVTLKTLAIAALMAKVGLYVPAKEPVEIPWFEAILADIGDEQSLQQSLSTFSGHIRRIGRILAALPSGRSSLILLDEVGAGTDPAEGSALAAALLQHLADRAYLTIATTHYGELKALKYQDQRFENASVEFDDVSLSPTYRLLWGIPGRSNALAIALRLGLDPTVIEAAQQQVGLTGGEVNEIIAGLEAQRREQETKAEAARQLLVQAEQFYAEVSQKAAELQAREQNLKIAQEQTIQAEVAAAKGEIAKVIRHLQRGSPTAQDAQRATAELERLTAERANPPPPPVGYQPKVGERIRISRLGQTAEVLTNADERGNLQVRLGLMSVSVSLTDVESLTGEKPKIASKPPKVPKAAPSTEAPVKDAILIRTARNTIDVRGQRVDSAVIEVDRAMNAAYASGILWIIHGKGTGKLREGIHDFLRSHGQVLKIELASNADGGNGVTIAHLR
jgi:DNA mismatch repair protein MutS2